MHFTGVGQRGGKDGWCYCLAQAGPHLELLTESQAQGRVGSRGAHPGATGLKKGCSGAEG